MTYAVIVIVAIHIEIANSELALIANLIPEGCLWVNLESRVFFPQEWVSWNTHHKTEDIDDIDRFSKQMNEMCVLSLDKEHQYRHLNSISQWIWAYQGYEDLWKRQFAYSYIGVLGTFSMTYIQLHRGVGYIFNTNVPIRHYQLQYASSDVIKGQWLHRGVGYILNTNVHIRHMNFCMKAMMWLRSNG